MKQGNSTGLFTRRQRNLSINRRPDDGAQALCLLDSLITCGEFQLKDFSDRLLAWYQEGLWAVGGLVFDIGIQTCIIFHKHRASHPYHRHGRAGSLRQAVKSIQGHDRYQIEVREGGGRKEGSREKEAPHM